MKKFIVVAVLTGSLGMTTSVMATPNIDKQLETQLVEVCEALRSNSRLQLLKSIKNNRFTYRNIASNLRCNGDDAVTFALKHDANTTADFIAGRANIDVNALLAKR